MGSLPILLERHGTAIYSGGNQEGILLFLVNAWEGLCMKVHSTSFEMFRRSIKWMWSNCSSFTPSRSSNNGDTRTFDSFIWAGRDQVVRNGSLQTQYRSWLWESERLVSIREVEILPFTARYSDSECNFSSEVKTRAPHLPSAIQTFNMKFSGKESFFDRFEPV